ncbi:zf-TFIIB domain-containing protein [Chloroflexota bacterium]
MNCKNCGGPMNLYREQDYYHCEYCNSFHFPSASSDGIRLVGEAPEGTLCPNCRIPMDMATLDDAYRGYQCKNCQGLLLSRGSFRMTIETRRAKATTPPEQPKPLNQEELNRKLDCPICDQVMSTHPYMGPGTIVIDTCDQCNVIWLDTGELERVVNSPGKDHGAGLSQVFKRLDDEQKKMKQKKAKNNYDINLLDLLGKIF